MSRKHHQRKGARHPGAKTLPHLHHPHPGNHPPKHHPPVAHKELTGLVHSNEKGFGFFIPEDGSPDAFIPPREMRGIMNGDRVRGKVYKDPRKQDKFAAKDLSIVQRAHQTIVGILNKEQGRWLVKPDDFRLTQPIHLPHAGSPAAQAGQKVLVKITKWPGNGPMEGQLTEVLGFPDDPGVDIKTVIRKYQWPDHFQKQVLSQVEHLPEDPSSKDWEGRMDLRKLPILTIDGKDAKDFDDAISLEKEPNGNFRLGVHIADVSYYVHEGTPLDEAAKERATSLYLADRVLPMLPTSLSDGLCSLKEGVPRLTVSAFLTYSPTGKLVGTHFSPSVIQSSRRGVYEEIQEVLDGTSSPELRSKYSSFKGILDDMVELSRKIRKQREALGSLDFDFPEVRAVMDSAGKVVDVRKKERLETHRLIEDFMVAANEAVATFLSSQKEPTLFRIHEPPNTEDLEELVTFLRAYHIPFKGLDLSKPLGLQRLLASVKGGPFEAVVSNLALRSLKLAVYSTRNAGHFGLALKSYCHFTSPIRRYPDLVVHRTLKKVLHNGKAAGAHSAYEKLALHCSFQERNAEKAERECQKVMQLRFMENKVGQLFSGSVRHLTPYGLYLELEPFGIEGFLPLESLRGDQYQFDPAAMLLRGQRGSKIQLSDILKVRVQAVDMAFQRLLLTNI